jgi:hypothetical protein
LGRIETSNSACGLAVSYARAKSASDPLGVAVDSTNGYIYWASAAGTIGRANLKDGSGAQQIITGAGGPQGITVDGTYVYWANHSGTVGACQTGRQRRPRDFISGARIPSGNNLVLGVGSTAPASTGRTSTPARSGEPTSTARASTSASPASPPPKRWRSTASPPTVEPLSRNTDSGWSRVAKQRVASLHHRTVIAASVGVISAQDLHLLLANENKSAAGGTRRACCRWALRVGSSRRDTRAVRCIAWLGRFILCSVREITKRDESHLIT